MSRRNHDPDATREKILSAATLEFAGVGLDGGRVDRIARRCGLSKNMLYYYFKSKENLFLAVLERMYEDLRERQKDLLVRTGDPIAGMEQLVRHTFAALEGNPAAIPLMNEENKHRGRYLRRSSRMRGLYQPLVETIAFILDRGCKDGVFRPALDPATVYLTLSSLCYHYLSNQHTLEIALDRDLRSAAARDAWVDHVTEVVLLACVRDPALLDSRSPALAAPEAPYAPARRVNRPALHKA